MTDEEKEKYLRLNIPKPKVISSNEITEEEKKKREEEFLKFIREMKKHPRT